MRRWFICITFILMAGSASATGGAFDVGGNISLNTSWILNQNTYEILRETCEDEAIWGSKLDYSLTPGVGVGGSVSWNSGSWWGFVAELNYVKAGQNYKDGFSTSKCPEHSDFKRKFAIHYIQLPMLAKFSPQTRSKVKWYVVAGPQLGLRLGAKDKVILSGTELDESMFTTGKDQVKTIDLSLVVGAGTDITIDRNLYINVGLVTSFGLLDMNSKAVKDYISENGGEYRASRNFSVGIQAGVHYVFDWVGKMYR